jgi:hypothetical protein
MHMTVNSGNDADESVEGEGMSADKDLLNEVIYSSSALFEMARAKALFGEKVDINEAKMVYGKMKQDAKRFADLYPDSDASMLLSVEISESELDIRTILGTSKGSSMRLGRELNDCR